MSAKKVSSSVDKKDFAQSDTSTKKCVSLPVLQHINRKESLQEAGNPRLNPAVVEKLLERLFALEDERSELLAANRSWESELALVRERHLVEVEGLRRKLEQRPHAAVKGGIPAEKWREVKEQMSLLKHQAQIYREDFLEERKARVRAHAQLEVLRTELKRKSRAKMTSVVPPSSIIDEGVYK